MSLHPGVFVYAGIMQNMQSRTVTVGNKIPSLPAIYLTFACPDPRCDSLTHNASVPDTRNGHKDMHAFVAGLIRADVEVFKLQRIDTDGTREDITRAFLWKMVKDEAKDLLNEILGESE